MNERVTRYRRPKVTRNQIKIQKSKIDGDIDLCVFYGAGIPRCDQALALNVFCAKRQYTDYKTGKPRLEPSLIDEMEARGYDMDTLRFSIEKKKTQPKGE